MRERDGGEEERHEVDGPREEEAQREEERHLADDRGAALVVQVVDGVAQVGIGQYCSAHFGMHELIRSLSWITDTLLLDSTIVCNAIAHCTLKMGEADNSATS